MLCLLQVHLVIKLFVKHTQDIIHTLNKAWNLMQAMIHANERNLTFINMILVLFLFFVVTPGKLLVKREGRRERGKERETKCVFVCLSAYLSVCLCLSVSVCMSVSV